MWLGSVPGPRPGFGCEETGAGQPSSRHQRRPGGVEHGAVVTARRGGGHVGPPGVRVGGGDGAEDSEEKGVAGARAEGVLADEGGGGGGGEEGRVRGGGDGPPVG